MNIWNLKKTERVYVAMYVWVIAGLMCFIVLNFRNTSGSLFMLVDKIDKHTAGDR